MMRSLVWSGFGGVLCLVALGCAGGGGGPAGDGGHHEGGMDGALGDGASEASMPDGGGDGDVDMMHVGTANTCETCVTDADCVAGYCANLVSGGRACLP